MIFVSPHNQLFFGAFWADWADWFGSFARNIQLNHVIGAVVSISINYMLGMQSVL